MEILELALKNRCGRQVQQPFRDEGQDAAAPTGFRSAAVRPCVVWPEAPRPRGWSDPAPWARGAMTGEREKGRGGLSRPGCSARRPTAPDAVDCERGWRPAGPLGRAERWEFAGCRLPEDRGLGAASRGSATRPPGHAEPDRPAPESSTEGRSCVCPRLMSPGPLTQSGCRLGGFSASQGRCRSR